MFSSNMMREKRKLGNRVTTSYRLVAVAASFFILSIFLSSREAFAQAAPFPASFSPRDVTVYRSWDSTQTLRLRFELSLPPSPHVPSSKTASYLVAGSPLSPPRVRVTACHLYRVRGNEVVGETWEMPSNMTPQGGLTRINEVGLFRQYKVYSLTLNLVFTAQPLIPNANETWVVDFVELVLDLGAPPLTGEDAEIAKEAFSSPALAELTDAVLLNADINSRYYYTTSTSTWEHVRSWATKIGKAARSNRLFKATFYRPGIYRVTREMVSSEGGTSATTPVSADKWRVLSKGEEISAIPDPDAPESSLLFVVPEWDIDEFGPACVWLDASGENEEHALPRRSAPAAPSHEASSLGHRPVVMREYVAEELVEYQARIKPNSDVTRWYWKSIPPDSIGTFTVTLPSTFASDEPVSVSLYYAMSYPRQLLPRIEIFANGESVTTAPLTTVQGSVVVGVPPHSLHAGKNLIGVRSFYTDDSPEEKRDVLVQKFIFRWNQSPDVAPEGFFRLVGNEAADTVLAFPDSRKRLLVASCDADSPWYCQLSSGESVRVPSILRGKKLFAVALDEISSPPVLQHVSSQMFALLDPPTGSDYLVIAPSDFASALIPLAQRRIAQGFKPRVVSLEHVFDLFGYGWRSSEAIRQFLSYCFYSWPHPKLSYVLLVGEASEYRRDPALAPPKCQIDILPTCGSARRESVHGDHPYGCVAGTDPLPDVPLGRLSVASSEELTSAIAKLLRYEDTPVGEWATRAVFVCDDNEEFPRVAKEIVAAAGGPSLAIRLFEESSYPYVPNTRVYGKRRSWEATRALLSVLDEGVGFVTYFGHGGPNIWSHERLLHIMDLPKLREPSHLPFIACASCDNAWLDYPLPPVKASMGELFVKQERGGAIAVFAPVSGATPYEHQNLMLSLTEALTRTPLRRVGDVSEYARISYYAQTLSASIPEQYVLVGDPGVQLKVPAPQADLTIDPPAIPALRPASVSVRASGVPPDCTSASLALLPVGGGASLLSRPVAILGGNAQAVVTIEGLQPGSYTFLLSAEGTKGLWCSAGRLDAVTPRLAFNEEALLSQIRRPIGTTETLRTQLSFFNPTSLSDVTGCAEAVVSASTDSKTSFSLFRDCCLFAPGMTRRYAFPWGENLAEEILLRWEGKKPEIALQSAHYALPRINLGSPTRFILPYGVRITSPQLPSDIDTLTFAAEIWNTGVQSAEDVRVSLYSDGEPVAQPQLLSKLPSGGKREMIFTSKQPLSAGEHHLTVRLDREDHTVTDTQRRIVLHEQSETVRIAQGPDLEFVPGSVTTNVPEEGIVARTSVIVRALLRNNGEVPARNVTIQLLVDDPTTGTEALMLNEERAMSIAELPPKEAVPVEVHWENCNDVGSPKAWLVVNRTRTQKETNYDNNVIAVPPFKVRQLGDFRVESLDVAPQECEQGSTVTVACAFSSDADIPRGPLDIEYGLRNPLTGLSRSEHDVIASVPPLTTSSLCYHLRYEPAFTEVFVNINSNRELEERDAGGDEQVTPIYPVLPLAERLSSEKTKLDLSSDFERTVAYNVELIPGGGVRLRDTFTSSSGMIPASPAWAVSDNCTQKVSQASDTDNLWTVAPWLIEASRLESCTPLKLRVPFECSPLIYSYDVYLHAVSSNNYKGGRVGKFTVAVGEGEPVSCDIRPDVRGVPVQRYYLGRFELKGCSVDLKIAQTTGSAVLIKGVEIVPAAGVVTSPVYEFPTSGGDLWLVRFLDNGGNATVAQYRVRYGNRSAKGIEWQEWKDAVKGEVHLAKKTEFMQWQAIMHPRQGLKPVLKQVVLEKMR